MSLECTTEDCNNATSTYLCSRCVADLQAWIDLAHGYALDLNVTIARQDVLRRAGNPGGGGVASESPMPWNTDAAQLQQNLYAVDRDAKAYAQMADAAGQAWLIQEWCTKAERLISGPEPETINITEIRERVENIAPPMPTRQLLPWLREKAGITIKRSDINNWRQRGHLTPVEREPQPTYHPHEVLALWNQKETA